MSSQVSDSTESKNRNVSTPAVADSAVAPPSILRTAVYFPVPDVASIGAYYRDTMGFDCLYSAGDPAEFGIYGREGATVMFRRVTGASRLCPNEAQGGTWDVFCWVRGVDALFNELAAKGAVVVYPITVQPYGTREFAIRDPLGHVWGFGEDTNQQAPLA